MAEMREMQERWFATKEAPRQWSIPSRSATKVVAASNASFLSKVQADYVCDGTADDVQIQAAIDALPATGGKVVLSEGTFTLGAAIAPVSNVTIEGAGIGATTITLPAGGAPYIALQAAATAAFVTVRDLTFDGNKTNKTGAVDPTRGSVMLNYLDDALFERVRVTDSYDAGMLKSSADDAKRMRFVNCDVDNVDGIGIQIPESEESKVIGCRITDNGSNGLYIASTGCVVMGCFIDGNGGFGIECTGMSHGKIIGNDITYNDGSGIWLVDAYAVIIDGNRIAYNGAYGILEASSGGYHTITNNRLNNNVTAAQIGYISAATRLTDSVHGNYGIVNNENSGTAANKSDGGTIAHGMGATPTSVSVIGSVAGDLVSVTALDATNITVAIKDEGGGAGTAQTIYWQAFIKAA